MRVSQLFTGIVARSLLRAGDTISISQVRALVVIATHDNMTTTAIAEAMLIHPSNATRLVDRLVHAGLLARTPSTKDRRVILLDLTAAGNRLLQRIMTERRQDLSALIDRLSDQDKQDVLNGMQVLADAMDEPSAEHLII